MYLGISETEVENTGYRGNDEGGKLKERGTIHWNSPNKGATNETGFTALPGGDRSRLTADFGGLEAYANFWSSTEASTDYAYTRTLYYNTAKIARYDDDDAKWEGRSIRCIKD